MRLFNIRVSSTMFSCQPFGQCTLFNRIVHTVIYPLCTSRLSAAAAAVAAATFSYLLLSSSSLSVCSIWLCLGLYLYEIPRASFVSELYGVRCTAAVTAVTVSRRCRHHRRGQMDGWMDESNIFRNRVVAILHKSICGIFMPRYKEEENKKWNRCQ